MRLLGTMVPAMLLAGVPVTAASAQDAPSTGAPATGTAPATAAPSASSTAPAASAPADINKPIGSTPQPDINQPIGAGAKSDINQPIGTVPTPAGQTPADQTIAPVVGAPFQPVLATGVDTPAVGGSQGYGSPLFNVDSRTNVTTQGGAFFGGLPIPALGYSLSVSLLSFYETNMLRLNSTQQVPAGYSKGDFGFVPQISGSANLPFGRQQVYFSGSIGKDFYARNTSYDTGRFLVSGGLILAYASACHANLDASWNQSQSAQGLVPAGSYLPNALKTASFGASTGCSPSTGFQPEVSYRYSQARNTNNDALLPNDPTNRFNYAQNDLNNSNIVVSLGYGRPSLGRIGLFGSKSFNTYPNRSITIGQQTFTQGVNVTNLGVSYQRTIGTRINVDGSLFWVNSVPKSKIQPSNSSLGYSLNLNYRPSPKFGFSVNGSSNSTASPNSGSLYYLNRTFGAQFSYYMGQSLNLGLSAFTSNQNNKGLGVGLFPNQIQNSRLNNYRASLNWSAPNTKLSASLYILQQRQSADPTTFNYTNTSFGLSLGYRI